MGCYRKRDTATWKARCCGFLAIAVNLPMTANLIGMARFRHIFKSERDTAWKARHREFSLSHKQVANSRQPKSDSAISSQLEAR